MPFLVITILVICVLATAACSRTCPSPSIGDAVVAPPSRDIEEHFLRTIWEGVYQMTPETRPRLHYEPMSCEGPEGPGCRVFANGRCVSGWAVPGNAHSLWTGTYRCSVFAHEMGHHRAFVLTGDIDQEHSTETFTEQLDVKAQALLWELNL